MLLGSSSSYFLGCSSDSSNWSNLHQENEHHFSCQNALPVRSYIYCRAGITSFLTILSACPINHCLLSLKSVSYMAGNFSNKNSVCFCWRKFCNKVFLSLHGETVFIKQSRGANKRSWNRNVPNCDFLFLGYNHMGWSCFSH